ncbi:MFS transporter [Sporosarcina sp. HYO08]|uniref:MFS transporter n=1 Tax=Sporosarcina sp. HYO08 TaxID=1759557 RepID=UPI0020A2DDFE|nr:MFS transporter [Sporosarcina sp. HYO08]
MLKEPIWTKPFISLFFTNIAVFIVFYGLVATLPLYAIGELGRTDEEAGLLMTIFLLSAIIVRPFTGKILDLAGKRKMLWLSLFLYLICTILYYFIPSYHGLLILRFVQGIWFSIVTTASGALAADTIPVKRRGTGLGYYAMSTNTAVVLGPIIALYLIQTYSFHALFIVLSVLMMIGSASAVIAPKGTVSKVQLERKRLTIHDLFEKNALPIASLGSLLAFSYASVLSYLSIYAQQKGILEFASSFFFVFAAVMLLTRPFTGKVFDEKGPKYIITPGFVFFIIGLIVLAFSKSAFTFLIAGGFIGLGYGALVPSFQTLAIQSAKQERSGYATATFFTLFDTGLAAGSYVLGLVAIYFGYQSIYFVSCGVLTVVFLFYLLTSKRQKGKAIMHEGN